MSPHPGIKHWWAIEAMIASYNHVYKVVYGTTYQRSGPIGVSDYGMAPIASFQLEFLALSDDPQKVARAIDKFRKGDRQYVLDVFHESPSAREVKAQYIELGYEFIRTGPVLAIELPLNVRADTSFVRKVESAEQIEFANQSLGAEEEHIPVASLGDPHIQNFYAEMDGQAVGWAQLVTIYPDTGYINQLFTLSSFRGRRVGTALVERIHMECHQRGIEQIVLVSSEIALGLYRRLGYRPLVYFTAFRPKEEKK
jgi:GNAT superfamily N-acetyltransferase